MKKIILILLALTLVSGVFAQVKDTSNIVTQENNLEAIGSDSGDEVTVGKESKVKTTGDTTRISFLKNELIIIEKDDETEVYWKDKKNGTKTFLYTEKDADQAMEKVEELELEKRVQEEIKASIEKAIADAETNGTMNEEELAELEKELKDLDEDLEEMEKELDDEDADWWDYDKKDKKDKKFEGHWASMDIGINGLVNSDYSMDYEPEWLNLNTSKSWNFNLNFAQQSISIVPNHLGLVTGVGIEWNGYNFDGKNNIKKVDGVLEPDSTYASFTLKKNKMRTTYLTVPLLIEIQPSKKEDFYFAAGVIGGLKIMNSTKIVYYDDNDDKRKEPRRGDDLNLRTLRYGVIAKLGYDDFGVFVRYYLSSMFEKDGDPELYPFAIGISMNF